jgi:hypothetical protein
MVSLLVGGRSAATGTPAANLPRGASSGRSAPPADGEGQTMRRQTIRYGIAGIVIGLAVGTLALGPMASYPAVPDTFEARR